MQLPGAKAGGDFLKVFGKPDRLLTCECERSEATTLAQAFQLINGEAVRARLEAPDNRIGRLLRGGADDAAILDEALPGVPLPRADATPSGRGALAYVARAQDRRKAWEDVAWAILNSKEFLLAALSARRSEDEPGWETAMNRGCPDFRTTSRLTAGACCRSGAWRGSPAWTCRAC